jgi:hypothetical protein
MEFVTTYKYTDGELVPEFSPREGINPVDFIKPDPSYTRRETRAYILRELKHWLCGLRMSHAVEHLITEDEPIDSIKDDVAAGMFPAGRMYMILRRLDPTLAGIWGSRDIGYLSYSICAAHLTGQTFHMSEDIQSLILGFITTDQLHSGRVIESFWDYSPFDPLREAPSLSEVEDEVEEVEEVEDEDEEDEVDEVEEVEEPKDPGISPPAVLAILILINLLLFFLAKAAMTDL